jgi:hypothetical protein
MPTDAERWRFLADHKLTLHTDGGDYLVHWVRSRGPGEQPRFFPVSNGRSADEAIARYERKRTRVPEDYLRNLRRRPVRRKTEQAYKQTLKDAAATFHVGRLFGMRSRIVHDGELLLIHYLVEGYLQAVYADVLCDHLGIPTQADAETIASDTGRGVTTAFDAIVSTIL